MRETSEEEHGIRTTASYSQKAARRLCNASQHRATENPSRLRTWHLDRWLTEVRGSCPTDAISCITPKVRVKIPACLLVPWTPLIPSASCQQMPALFTPGQAISCPCGEARCCDNHST